MTEQEKKWQELSQWAETVTDAVGCSIDEGIRETVIAMNAIGIHTLASCEGHLERSIAAPWVDIGHPDARPAAKEAHLKLLVAQEARVQDVPLEQRRALIQEAEAAKLVVKRLHLVERLKLIGYLNDFYVTRIVPYHARLILNQAEWSGIIRLESQGADYQDCLPIEERAQKLREYQDEMRAFTAFLKATYFK